MNSISIKRYLVWVIIITLQMPLIVACVDETEYEDTPQGNFEALWKIIDECMRSHVISA